MGNWVSGSKKLRWKQVDDTLWKADRTSDDQESKSASHSPEARQELERRVSALAGLAGAISANALAKHFGGESTMVRPIETLRKYVSKARGVELARTICDPLSHLHRLR